MTPYGRVLKGLGAMSGVEVRPSRFGESGSRPLGAFVRGREFAHFHGTKAIDIRLTRLGIRRSAELLGDRPRRQDWVEIALPATRDAELALRLLGTAREMAAFR